MRGQRRLSIAVLCVAIVQSGCMAATPTSSPPASTPQSSPATTQPPTASDEPTLAPPLGPTSAPEPIPSLTPETPSSADLIEAALAGGVLDEPTATLYRLYASVADDRLPEAYRTDRADEDDAVDDLARIGYESYPAQIQEQMLPFLVRPTSPLSYWAAPPSTAIAEPLANVGPLIAQAASGCVDGWVERFAVVDALVWGQCGGTLSDADVVARTDEAARYIHELWPKMTRDMGPPIGDQGDPADPNDDFIEANDGLLDIYLIAGDVGLHGRYLQVPSIGQGASHIAFPFNVLDPASTSSTYITIKQRLTGRLLKATIAHEFFHALQAAHNRFGTRQGRNFFWFVEASARWSEYEWVREAKWDVNYGKYMEFARAGESLSSSSPFENPYRSWAWPLFMAQEAQASSVAVAWRSMEHQYGFLPLQTAVDGALSFKTRFRDFGLRVWNELLDPGDPIERWQQYGDGEFPLFTPPAPRLTATETLLAERPTEPPHEIHQSIPSLTARYSVLEVDPDVGQVILDFSPLTPTEALDVDLLVKVEGELWERRKVDNGRVRFCRDNAPDRVDKIIVSLSNHDLNPATRVTGHWTYQGLAASCAALSGTLTVTRTGQYNSADGPEWTRSEQMTATIVVDMEPDPDPFGGGGYIDWASTYTIRRTTLETRQMGDCTASYGTKTNGTWEFVEQPVSEELENGITGFVDYDLDIVVLTIVTHYPYEATELCNLYSIPNVGVSDLFACSEMFGIGLEGALVEIDDGPDEVWFDCTDERPAMGWTTYKLTVTGTLILKDEPPTPAP